MVAIYPAAIKKFAYRQDFTNIVDAADVNVLYDEVTAVENTLGPNPMWDTIDGKVNQWSTVSNRISAVREGVSKPFMNVSAHNVFIPFTSNNQVITWTNKTWDTHGIWSGGPHLVCPRSGVYTFHAYVRWHADNKSGDSQQTPYDRSGKLTLNLQTVNQGFDMVHDDRFFPQGFQAGTHMACSIAYPWIKGQAVQMVLNQTCLTTGITATVNCSITYHRDPPTTNNL